jgi:hypothetical protein
LTHTLRPVNIIERDPENPTNEILFQLMYAFAKDEREQMIGFSDVYAHFVFPFDDQNLVLTMRMDESMNPIPSNADTIRVYRNESDALNYVHRMTKALSE